MVADRTSLTTVATFEALLGWQLDPTPTRRQAVEEALAVLAAGLGARGAFLAVDAPPLPGLLIGYGSLRRRPGESPPPSIHRIDLLTEAGTKPAAVMWLDSPTEDPALPVRALELALSAARSRAELRQNADRLEALDAATRGIAGVFSLNQVLQLIADRVRELVGAQYAALGIVGEHGAMERFVTSGISAEQRRRIGAPPRGQGLLGLIVRENRTYRIPDIAFHPDTFGFPPGHPPMHAFLGVPIKVKGRSVGNFYLTNKQGSETFDESDERIVEMFALHAGVAIENARLHEQVERMAVFDERERISKDLHDGIIQSLYAIGLSLEDVPDLMPDDRVEAAARVDRAIDAINLAITDLRNFIFGLRPESAERQSLLGGLANIADAVRLNAMIDVELQADSEHVPDPPAGKRAELLQIAREALSNMARHSHATRATVLIEQVGTDLRLTFADNGRGFDVAALRPSSHQGLANMRARAEDLGGTLTIQSEIGQGTRIIVRVPAELDPTEAPAPPIQEIRS